MKNDFPIIKKGIVDNKKVLNWRLGEDNTNIILENTELHLQISRYEILDSDNNFLYDTISIKEPSNSTVLLIRNKKKEIGLVWEWRPIPAKWFWACIRGFGDPGDEDNIATAGREMIEEIGKCIIIDSKNLGVLYQNTAFFEKPIGLVLLDVKDVKKHLERVGGITKFKFYSCKQIISMIRKGKIEDTFTLSALVRYLAIEKLI